VRMETVHDEKWHYVLMCTLIHSLYFGTTSPFKCACLVRFVVTLLICTVLPVVAVVFYKVLAVLALVYYAFFFLMQYILLVSKIVILTMN
jgi:hypothetical protein